MILREHCLSKPFVTEEFPFDEETLVFKVFGKIFTLIDIYSIPLRISLKCDPIRAIYLRDTYQFITPGYHLNKKYWNTVLLDDIPNTQLIFELIDHSYEEVIKKLSQKSQREILRHKNYEQGKGNISRKDL
ncbi:MAG: MmcQ/YjbR family DNA-binding protein [Candidatus Kapaibacteriales bacterium]